MAKIKYTDYDGSCKGKIVIDGKLVPFDDKAARYIAQQTHLLALGDPEYAYKMVAESEQAEQARTNAA
jgi:hypothetical protein